VEPRAITRWYQTAARIWLSLAAVSLLLPASERRGLWLPLHLALAGAIATAISGAMQNFMLALTATPSPPSRVTWIQFALVTAGAALVAYGLPNDLDALVAVGGTAFVASMAFLGWMLWRAWSRSLHKRHGVPMGAYGAAVTAVVIGAGLGAVLGAGIVSGTTYVSLRHAHLSLNVLGFASLTVVGTLVTLLPTTLRVRMPSWPGRTVLGLLIGGVALQALAWVVGADALLPVGGVAYAGGAVGLVVFVSRVLRTERRWRPPLAAMHMLAAAAWFVFGSVGLGYALAHGPAGFEDYRTTFLVAFVGGWLVQVLLGAWAYLLPMQRPGHPDERRRMLSVFELAAPVQLVAINVGLVLLAFRGAASVGAAAGDLGVVLTAVGAVMGLMKAWLFPVIGRARVVDGERAREIWGG
jgi:nitrite reductase (NO-forming)